MKNTFSPFAKLIAVAACALTLGSCSRAEYAMLPKGGSYHGVTRVATPVPTAPVASPAPAADAVVAPAMALGTTTADATPTTTKLVAKAAKPVAATRALETASTVVATPAPKLNVLQRIALNKVTRKVDKLMQKSGTVRQHDNTASTARGISGNLRTGLILLLVGLLVSIFGGIFGLIGAIIAVIGLVFIILWLLDQA